MSIISKTKKLIISAMFLSLGMVLPFLTGQIQQIGSMLCPMHIPVLLCGFICGWQYGLVVGIVTPLLRSVCFGMPILFPMALCMAFELGTYGLCVGLLHKIMNRQNLLLYPQLIIAMILGRLVWGLMMFICVGLDPSKFTIGIFFAGAITQAIPGIILQLVIIPPIVMLVQKSNNQQ